MSHRVIAIQAEAPAKPAFGAACNGCGLCCLSEPCPLGMLVSRRRHGRCAALRWDAGSRHYRCGLLGVSADPAVPPRGSRLVRWLVWRWIAAGSGCDSTAEVIQSPQ